MTSRLQRLIIATAMSSDIASGEPVVIVRTKLAHARQHLEQLDASMERWTDRHPYAIRLKSQPKPEEWVYGLFFDEPFPAEWAVIVGEAVHDLRSALENVIYQLSIDNKGKALTGTNFPIALDPKYFSAKQIRGLGTEAKAFVRMIQPHASSGECGLNLWALQKMWNQDKHQLAQLWRLQLGDDRSTLAIDPPPKEVIYETGLLDHRAEIFRAIWDTDPTQVRVKGYLPIHIATDIPAAIGAPGDTLWAMHDWAVGVVSILLGMFGRQDVAPW